MSFTLRARFLLTLVLASCSSVDATPPPDVAVELSAVTLGDQCNNAGPPPIQKPVANRPPATQPSKPAQPAKTPTSPSVVAPADCAEPNCGGGHRGCFQTSMQLAIRATKAAKPTTIRVKKVELLDAKGKVLEVLTAKIPSKWTDKGYVAWDEAIGADQTLATSYALSTPDWDKHTKGRWHAHEQTFQLRVTVTIGTANRTIEKQSITPAMLEPAVPT